MISCIVCSRQPELLTELKENIASTIGCEYEMVVIDNSKNEFSIYSAYNKGILLAKGDILCFMHEDIVYHSQDWGKLVERYFTQNTSAGLLGVAGSHMLSKIPAGWWETKCISEHYIQGIKINGQYITTLENQERYRIKGEPTSVCAVDGLWLCMPKSLFEIVSWDDVNLSGFHGYDMDMSLQVWNAGYQVHILWDVLIEHCSLGNVNADFYATYEKIWEKWSRLLPMIKGIEMSEEELILRTTLVEQQQAIRKHNAEIQRIYQSKPYRLGKLLLKPFAWIRRIIKK